MMGAAGSQDAAQCRMCNGHTRVLFKKRVMERYDVDYLSRDSCGSLQTEVPTWLADAYAIPGVHIDIGQASRGLYTWLRVCRFLECIKFDKNLKCIDFGASMGLFARLMRDSGYNFLAYDLYDDCKLANYFKVETIDGASPALLTAFEVFEHFASPKEAVPPLLRAGAEIIIFSTLLYEGQGEDWHYLAPECGQHVFFYSAKALTDIAATYGYDFVSTPDFHVFVRRDSSYRTAIIEAKDSPIDAEFITRHVTGIIWNDAIARDQAYARKRLTRELREAAIAATSKKAGVMRLQAYLGRLFSRLRTQRGELG